MAIPWPLFRGRIKVMSTIASHWPLNISEAVRDRGLVPKDHQLEWPMGNQMVMWPMTLHDPERSNSQYLENSWRCYLATIANYYSLLWDSTVGYPSDNLASCWFPKNVFSYVSDIQVLPNELLNSATKLWAYNLYQHTPFSQETLIWQLFCARSHRHLFTHMFTLKTQQ